MSGIPPCHILERRFDRNDHVVTAIAVRLHVANVVLLLEDRHARKLFERTHDDVNVVDEAADDANADGVMHLAESRLRRLGQSFAAALLTHALVRLDAADQMLVGRRSCALLDACADLLDARAKRAKNLRERLSLLAIDAFQENPSPATSSRGADDAPLSSSPHRAPRLPGACCDSTRPCRAVQCSRGCRRSPC